jgi:excisionase family DNA binding protein
MRNSVIEKVPFAERRALHVDEACDYSGIGRTQLYELMNDGRIAFVTIGARRLVLRESLDKLLTPAAE